MIAKFLDAAIVALGAAVLLAWAGAGIDVELGSVRIRIQDWLRPSVALAIVVAVRAAATSRRSHPPPLPGTHLAFLALLLACTGVYLHHHVRVAGGLDSYGYVSTARLIAAGKLSEPQPLARVLPFDNALSAATPLGHVPRADGETSVPRFPIGLPLVMAAFSIFGPDGPFFVPLVMAVVALALTAALAQTGQSSVLAGLHAPTAPSAPIAPIAPLLAAALLAVDPLFAAYAMQPMSDVPATCWLLAAVWLALWDRARSAAGGAAAGLCGGMAILTRPALLPAVIVLLGLTWLSQRDRRKTVAFASVVLAVAAIQAGLNAYMYGSPFASGYGTASHMFELSLARLSANASNFGKWLTYSHTPLFWLMWPAALFLLRRERWAWQLSAVAAAAAAPYMFYIVFDDWESSRFLLPAIALVLVLFTRALAHLTHRPSLLRSQGWASPTHLTHLGFFLLALACAGASHRFLQREGTYRLATLEAKYALAGEWFRNNTSERAVVLASLHSGTIRMYGGRQSIRWDQIPPAALTQTVQRLQAAGFEPYLALDLPSEPPLFEERFHENPAAAEQIARVRVVNIYRLMSAY